jgi:hypothetical protein
MTPLAYRIMKDISGGAARSDDALCELLAPFREEFHCFEVTAVADLSHTLKQQMLAAFLPSIAGTFLPAVRTWIEWSAPDEKAPRGRLGVMLTRGGDGFADISLFGINANPAETRLAGHPDSMGRLGRIALGDELARISATLDPDHPERSERAFIQLADDVLIGPGADAGFSLAWQVYAFLLLINTPHVTTQTKHDPHRALARDIRAKHKTLGIAPLRPWTEITLTAGVEVVENAEHAATSATGTMPLHWTRSHLRRVLGVWTVISDYWSGDASSGVKQSRYKVVP